MLTWDRARPLMIIAALAAAVTGCSSRAPAPRIEASFTRLPLAFEPNVGQAPEGVRYVSRGPGMRLALTADAALLTPSLDGRDGATLTLRLIGASARPTLVAEDELPGKVHYFTGSDPSRWLQNVPTYRRVVYRGVYPGTDLVFHGTHGAAEFDFVVAPGADPRAIRLEVAGAEALRADGGDVLIQSGGETLRLHEPVVYQESASGRTRVDGRFRVQDRWIAFEIGDYDRTRPLVIDPMVTYSTFLNQGGVGVGVDGAGNMYSSGLGAIVKLSADGSTLLYSVVLGDMLPNRLAVDTAGNAYALAICPYPRSGVTYNCPTTSNALATGRPQSQGDRGLYVVKLSPDGSQLLYSSNVGGTGSPQPGGIAVDAAGNIYVTGYNVYGGFPTTRQPFAKPGISSGNPAFVEAIAADFSRFIYVVEFHTGSDNFRPSAIAVDRTGATYLTGVSGSEFPTTPGAFQPAPASDVSAAVVAKISPDGSQLVYGTYLGNRSIVPHGIAVDADGTAVVVGGAGAGLPTANALQPALAGATDAFVTRLNVSGSALLFSTYLGGGGGDSASGVGLDSSANMYVAGPTGSMDFPQRSPLSPTFGAAGGNFVTALTSDGSAFIYSTYFANSSAGVNALATSTNGIVYLTGMTTSSSYPTVRPYQATPGQAFLARIEPAPPRVFITSPAENSTVTGTVWSDVWLENTAAGSRTVTLTIGGTTVGSATGTSNHFTMPWDSPRVGNGTQTLVATVTDSSGTTGSDRRRFNVQNAGGGGGGTLTAAFTSPAAGATVSGNVTIGMSETGGSGTITFTLAVDSTQVFTASGTATTASFSWNSATVANGQHTLNLTVRDGAGRTATAARTITVNNPGSPPPPPSGTIKVFITQPSEGAAATGSVWFTIWIENAAAGSKTFTLSAGGVPGGSTTTTSNGPVTLTWDSRTVGNGPQTVTASVRDAAGNTGRAARTLNVQNAGGGAPPTLTASFTSPAEGATVSGAVTVGMSASGTSGPPITFTLTVDGGQVFTTSGSATTASYSWNTAGVADGAHTLGLSVSDGAGRTATATRSVTVSNGAAPPPPPSGTIKVFITQPAEGTTVRGTAWFTIWIENAAAGSKTYTLSVGGSTVATTSTPSNGPVSIPWATTGTPNGSRAVTVTVRDSAGATGSGVRTVVVSN